MILGKFRVTFLFGLFSFSAGREGGAPEYLRAGREGAGVRHPGVVVDSCW